MNGGEATRRESRHVESALVRPTAVVTVSAPQDDIVKLVGRDVAHHDELDRRRRQRQGVPDVAGDHLNARRFLEAYGGRVRRSPELGRWYIWSGAWWDEDRLDRVLEMAANVIDELRVWVAEAVGTDELKRRTAHYVASAKGGRRRLALDAGTDPDIVVAVDQLDAHPMLLACLNGTVDLATGELRPADPRELLTRGVAIDYDPAAVSDDWHEFVTRIFAYDDELITFVQRLLGYCCTGAIHDHVLPVLHGVGANGKSTMVGIVQDILGDHAMTAPEGLVIRHDHEPHPERIAALRGQRMVVSNELEQRAALAEQTVKNVDRWGHAVRPGALREAVQLHSDPQDRAGRRITGPRFRPAGMQCGGESASFPSVRSFRMNSRTPDLRRHLVDEHGPAVLAWLVRGAIAWHEHGLGEAAAVDAATEEYKASADVFGTFLTECTVRVPRAQCKVKALWDEWRTWCEQSGERPGRMQDFTAALVEHDLEVDTYQNARHVRDLGLRHVGEGS